MLTNKQLALIKQRNTTISAANKRLAELRSAKVVCSAREAAQGVEIKIERPGFGKLIQVAYELIPWDGESTWDL